MRIIEVAQIEEDLAKRNENELAELWLEVKRSEDATTAYRHMIESALCAKLPIRSEGALTTDLGNVKVTIIDHLNRSIDADKWKAIQSQVPPDLSPVEWVEKPVINAKGCRWLQENKPDLWAICAQAITTKPAKMGVKIVRKDAD
jgi:hypothetical protein